MAAACVYFYVSTLFLWWALLFRVPPTPKMLSFFPIVRRSSLPQGIKQQSSKNMVKKKNENNKCKTPQQIIYIHICIIMSSLSNITYTTPHSRPQNRNHITNSSGTRAQTRLSGPVSFVPGGQVKIFDEFFYRYCPCCCCWSHVSVDLIFKILLFSMNF